MMYGVLSCELNLTVLCILESPCFYACKLFLICLGYDVRYNFYKTSHPGSLKGFESFKGEVKAIFRFTNIKVARRAKNRLLEDYEDIPRYEKAYTSLDEGFDVAFQYPVSGAAHSR